MFYIYTITYSFDSDCFFRGPFDTEEGAWEAMLLDAKKELQIDKEDGWNSVLQEDKEAGEITVTTFFRDGDDVTRWRLFEKR